MILTSSSVPSAAALSVTNRERALMLILACSSAAAPCPLADQIWIESASLSSLADVGITPDQIVYVIGWGFGVVLFGFLMGWVLGLALGLIKKT